VASVPKMSEAMEKALGFNFENLFSWGDDENGPIMLDHRALLLYHPEDHLKELDLITRCLMGHHVNIGSAWFEGSWQAYAEEVLKTGSGVVFVSQRINQYFTNSELTDISGTPRL
jgi:chromo domain-containing protein 1